MQSPSTALRPWPIVSGPVGLADTNSTIACLPCPASLRPKAVPSRRTPATTPCQRARARKKLRKPGSGDLGSLEHPRLVDERRLQELRDRARCAAQGLGQDERRVGGEVPVLDRLSWNDRQLLDQGQSVGSVLAQHSRGRRFQELLDLITHGSFR